MPAVEAFKIGDTGSVLVVTVKEDGAAVNISSATGKRFIFRPPQGAPIVKDATFTTTGTDGKLQYTFEASFLKKSLRRELVGKWTGEVELEELGTWTGTSTHFSFNVEDTIR